MSHELLLNAVKNGQIDKVLDILRQLFSSGDDTLNKIINTDYGFRLGFIEQEITAIPLHLAVYNNDLLMVKLLLQYGADPTIKDQFDRDALNIALNTLNIVPEQMEDKIGIIDQLCLQGAVLEEDALDRHTKAMAEILNRCPPEIINMKQKILERVLFEEVYLQLIDAIKLDDTQTINALLKEDRFSAFHPYKDESLCSISLGVIRNEDHVYYGHPSFLSVQLNSPTVLKTLHETHGFSLAIKDENENTLLHYAVRYNRLATAEYLLEHGLDAEILNKNNYRPQDFLHRKRPRSNTERSIEPMTLLFNQYRDGSIPSLKWISAKTVAAMPANLQQDDSKIPEHLNELLNMAMEIKRYSARPRD